MINSIISFLSENLYYLVFAGVVIMLIVSFIIGAIKMRTQRNLIEEERKKNEIKAPKSNKRFVQGEKIEKQDIVTPNKSEDEDYE